MKKVLGFTLLGITGTIATSYAYHCLGGDVKSVPILMKLGVFALFGSRIFMKFPKLP